MRLALHSASIMHTNVMTDIAVARACGFDGVELWMPKLQRFLDAGMGVTELVDRAGPLHVTMLDVLMPVETVGRGDPRGLLEQCRTMAATARALECPALQVVALDGFAGERWSTHRGVVTSSLRRLAEVAAEYGVKLGIEPVVFSPFNAVWQVMDVIEAVGRAHIGIVLDTWHLWASGVPIDDIAGIDAGLVICAQLSDSGHRAGPAWADSDRTALPGDGVVPLDSIIHAIAETGFDGVWSIELHSRRHWEWEPYELGRALVDRARAVLSTHYGQ
jgi:sugar phosphate isomerase/epimerase